MRTWFLVTCCLLLLAVSLVSGDTQPSTLPVSPPPPFNDDGLAAAEYNKDDDEQQETKKKDGIFALLHHIEGFASRFVKQDTLSAARSIRQMLETMDDHGIVDLLAHHEPTQILVCIYALSKLQAACQFYERSKTTTSLQEETNNVVDLALLQDLYDCIPFATAAYGWKFNLATSGKWHKGDRQALVKMTQVDPSDIVTVNWEARPNRPVSTLL
mmetsp:Transcript_4905/g.11672  ORF Transcript_4905/g.11672 Transcript_4905/m.11672 type:complete len:214 (-) Transcript_4905:102-743(-)